MKSIVCGTALLSIMLTSVVNAQTPGRSEQAYQRDKLQKLEKQTEQRAKQRKQENKYGQRDRSKDREYNSRDFHDDHIGSSRKAGSRAIRN